MTSEEFIFKAGMRHAAAGIAYRIRAELVCCTIFDDLEYMREPDYIDLTRLAEAIHGHNICYWGEAAAKLAEDPSSWEEQA